MTAKQLSTDTSVKTKGYKYLHQSQLEQYLVLYLECYVYYVIHGFVHPGVANRTDPDVCQSDKLLRSDEQIFVAIQQTHDLAFIHEALIHSILCDGIEQLALAADFLKQLDAIAMGTLPDFLAHDELAHIHFAGKTGLFDLLLQVMEFTSVQTDDNGMISFSQRSTPLLFFFMGLF